MSFSTRTELGPGPGSQLAQLAFGDNTFVFVIASASSGVRLAEQRTAPAAYRDVPLGSPPSGVFVRYTLTVDLDAMVAKVATDVQNLGGTMQLQLAAPQPASFRIGNVDSSPEGTSTQAWFDDVVIR